MLCLMQPMMTDDAIQITYQDQQLTIGLDHQGDTKIEGIKLFEHSVTGWLVPGESAEWFSDALGQSVRLVAMDKGSRTKWVSAYDRSVPLSFADGYPVLFLGTASVDHLAKQLPDIEVSHDRFRANVILETENPHEEDSYGTFTLGGASFAVVKPCARCQVVTVDQSSAQIHKQVLTALASYRKVGSKVMFGANVICTGLGELTVGDLVERQMGAEG